MARQVLGGPADEGRSSYQVQLTVCERCARAAEVGAGEEVPVTPEVVERAACDATHVGAGRATQAIPPATRRRVLRRDRGRCVVPGCRHHVWVDVRAIAEARAHVGAASGSLEELLRQALIAHRRYRSRQGTRAG